MPDALANGLRALRADRKLTQAQLAELVGVTRKTVNTIENGVFVPSTVIALKMAKALDVPVEKLFWLPESERF